METLALLDPQVSGYIGAMYAFFEMESLFDLRLKKVDGQICICFGESQYDTRVISMNRNLMSWYEWNFPHSTMENAPSKAERARKERAAHLLEQLLNNEDPD